MIQMIITDLDKTLMRSETYISDYTVSILNECRARGIKIVYATARSRQAATRYMAQFVPDIFIGYGGALAQSGGDIIQRFDIPADISYQLINECLQTPGISSVHASSESIAVTSHLSDLAASDSSHYKYYDFTQENGLSYLKISVIATDPKAVDSVASRYPALDLLRYTGEDLYRFANRNALKWNAVQAVAAHYSVDVDSLVAFGDDINDLEMIKNCGTGVAVANAIESVKAVADCICESNDEDGVAKWIAEHVL